MAVDAEIDETNPEFRALAWLNRLPVQHVDGERRLVDVTSFDGYPLWWVVHPYVSRDFLVLGRKVASGSAKSISKVTGLAAWPFKAVSDPLLDAKLGTAEVLPGLWTRYLYAAKAAAGRKLLRMFYNRYVPAKWKLRKRVGEPAEVLDRTRAATARVLAVSHSRLWGHLGWGQQGDLVLEPVLEELRSRGCDVVGAEVDYGERGETATLRRRRESGRWFAFEALFDRTVERRYREAQAAFAAEFVRLTQREAFRSIFRFEGVDLYPLLKVRLELIFLNLLPHAVRLVELARRLLETVEPDAILLAYETGPAGRAVSAVARRSGVPTVAVQHGRIHVFHHHYAQCLGIPEGCPDRRERLLPDVTALYGVRVAEVLARHGGYAQEDMAVTGQPRTDLIVRGADRFDRKAFLEETGANPDLPVVLLATQNFPDLRDRMRVLEVVFGRRPGEWQVLVKPHPGERDGLVERFLRERSVPRAVVLRQAELYSCLAAADVVATGTSTVGMEALLFSKPVVTIGGLPSPLDLASVGAAIEVNSSEEFQETLIRLLEDASFRNRLLSRAEKYVRSHFDGVDGQASARVVDLIEARMRRNE